MSTYRVAKILSLSPGQTLGLRGKSLTRRNGFVDILEPETEEAPALVIVAKSGAQMKVGEEFSMDSEQAEGLVRGGLIVCLDHAPEVAEVEEAPEGVELVEGVEVQSDPAPSLDSSDLGERIRAVVAQLDPQNSEDYTSRKQPRLDVVSSRVGEEVTRRQIKKALG